MTTHAPKNMKNTTKTGEKTRRTRTGSSHVTEARAAAQRVKLDAQAEAREQEQATTASTLQKARSKKEQGKLQATRRASTTIARTIDDYLLDHEGGNHSAKTLEWHRTALGLMRSYFEKERGITLVSEVEAADINAWFAHMRKSPGGHGKPRSERTIQTYARSARAFFHWLVRRETIARNPFDRVTFPRVGKPLIQTIDSDEFERLLLACAPPNEAGPIAERATVRNRAILWVLYDTCMKFLAPNPPRAMHPVAEQAGEKNTFPFPSVISYTGGALIDEGVSALKLPRRRMAREADWFCKRATWRWLLQHFPHWTNQAYADYVGASVGWVKIWKKRLKAADPGDLTVLHAHSSARKTPAPPAASPCR